MSAVIQTEYTGNGTRVSYPFTFPYLKTSDIKASLDGVETTAFTLPNATTLQFNTAPSQDVKIKIFRETSVDTLTATFYAGSAIKSEDLNDNFTQNLYKTQEVGARAISALGGTMTGNLTLDTQADLVFEGATADAHETTIKVVDPTADRTITFPNVTGTVVTTGDTGTVATGMIAGDAVTGAKIADDQINSEHYVDGSIDTQHIADAQVTTAKIADSNVTTGKLADNAVTTAKIANDAVTNAKIGAGAISTDLIAADAVTNAKIADNSIDSEHYVDGSIDNAHLADNSITLAKMADDSVGTAELVDGSVDTARLADNSVTLAKIADNSVGTSEIVNDAVTTAKIAANAVTHTEIGNDAIDSRNYVDGSIDLAHLANASVDNSKLADNAVTTAKIANGQINTLKIADQAVTTAKIPDNQITTDKIADAELKTLAGMQSGTASKLADSTALTADIADLNQIDGLTKQTTISDSDASFPTSGAVVDYVAAQIAPLGGLEVIANENAFPTTQPASGVVISISDAGGVVVGANGSSNNSQTGNGATVTINGFPASLQSSTLAAGIGLMVSSTGSSQTYNYHKILGKEDDIKQLSDDINDFQNRYRVGSSNPTSALDAGDLFFNTSTSKLLVYNATNTAWEEAQSIGNFFISALSPAFDGSTQDFTITNAPANAQQILLSINGVVQKPNAGTSTPSEGFALSGSTVKLAAAPASGSIYHAVVLGSTVNIGTPSNNTVTTDILQNGSVTTAKIAALAVTQAEIANGAVGENQLASGAVITGRISDNAVTTAKIADNAVTNAKIANGNVSTLKIADDAVTVAKIQNFGQNQIAGRIASGTGNLQGLLASDVRTMINVADGANQTTINNNADNRVITGSGTTNTLNGESNLVFDGDNLGLGTGSPTYTNALFGGTQRALHLTGTTAPQLRIQSGTSGQADLLLQAGNSSAIAYIANATSGGDLYFSTNNGGSQGTRLVIKDDGKVGLGTENPAALLTLNQTIPELRLQSSNNNFGMGDEVGRISLHGSDGTTPGAGEIFRIRTESSSSIGADYTTRLYNRHGVGGGATEVSLGNGQGSIYLSTNTAGDPTPSVRMVVLSSGNVGIGTTNPTAPLHVYKAAHYVVTDSGKAAGGIHVRGANGNAGEYGGAISFSCGDGDSSAAIAARQGGSDADYTGMSFFTHPSGVGADDAVEKVRIHHSGQASFNDGICLGNGLTLSTDNTLDDYEEGAWTPDLQFGGSNTGIGYNSRYGHYTKIGQQVTVIARINLNSKGSASGAAKIEGLPFTTRSISGTQMSIGPIWFSGASIQGSHYYMICRTDGNTVTYVEPKNVGYSSEDTVGDSDFGNGTDMTFTITYLTSS